MLKFKQLLSKRDLAYLAVFSVLSLAMNSSFGKTGSITNIARDGGCSTVCINSKCQSSCSSDVETIETPLVEEDVVTLPIETREYFTQLELSSLDVEIIYGEGFEVIASGVPTHLDKLHVSQEADLLSISLASGTYLNGTPTLKVKMPIVSKLSVSGASTVNLSGFFLGELQLQLSGANRVDMGDTRITHLLLSAQGANQLDWRGGGTKKFSVDSSGANKLRVNFVEADGDPTLLGQLNGASQLSICGHVAINQLKLTGASNMKYVDCQ